MPSKPHPTLSEVLLDSANKSLVAAIDSATNQARNWRRDIIVILKNDSAVFFSLSPQFDDIPDGFSYVATVQAERLKDA